MLTLDKRFRHIQLFKKSLFIYIIISGFLINISYTHADDTTSIHDISQKIQHLGLSPEEIDWLKTHPTIEVAGPKYFPPFHFFENEKEHRGISVDYLYTILAPLGIQVKVHKNLPWSQVLKMIKQGEIDLIPCAAKTQERMKYMDFSKPYLSFPLVIISRSDADFIGGIEDLNGKKLAVVKKGSTSEWLKQDRINFISQYVNSPREGLEFVSFGKADARIENLAAATYLIQKYGLANLKIAAPTPYGNYDLHMAVKKDVPHLMSIINKSLSAMEPLDHSDLKNKWLSVRYEFGIKKSDILKWFIPVVFCSIVIVSFMLVWNRKLKKESSQRKLAQEKLKESEQKYRHLFNNAPAGMYEINFKENRFLSVNEVICSYSGYSEEEFLAIDPITLLAPESQLRFLERLEKLNPRENFSDAVEYNIIKKDGTQMSVVLNGDYFFKNDKLASAQVVVHDITSLKQAEKEKIEAQKIAGEHEKLALVGKIAGKMAHDFNNILGIIMGNTEISLIECKEPKQEKLLKSIFKQTLRGKNLTRNLVAFAKDQEPRQKFFKLKKKIDLVLSLLKKDLEGINVIREDIPEVPELLADPGMIEHTIVNLVQNSIHAVSKKSYPKICIRSFCLDDNICFEIEDNGCGISEEYLENIYEPAFTLKGSRDELNVYAPGIKGAGYGLSNIKKYIEQHNGQLHVVSSVGEGTKFTILLPVIEKEIGLEESENHKPIKISSGKNILLVEDEKDISDILTQVLTQEPLNHSVDVAQDASSAIELIEKNTYDFVSLDYILPGKATGMDVYQHIRKTDKKTPILFISGNFTFLESVKALKQKDAYIDHLSKPCQNKDYVACINHLMLKSQA